jgi:hypothetical protein
MAVAQQAPIEFKIAFCVTSNGLNITPHNIDFGKIYSGMASKCEITLRNESIL